MSKRKVVNEKRRSKSEKERGENGGGKSLGEILSDEEIILPRRIEQDIEGIIIECANGGTPYTESSIPSKKTGQEAIFYCWVFPQENGRWVVSEERLVGKDGVMVILNKELPSGGKIEIDRSFCGTAFATVL